MDAPLGGDSATGGVVPPGPRNDESSAPLTVLVADDHVWVRAGLVAILRGNGFAVVTECPDAPSAVAAAVEHRPDVCLLDVSMPGDGISAVEEIARRVPTTRIVMVTVSTEEADLLAALRAGAHGYLLKDSVAECLADTIRGVIRGEAALSRAMAARVVREFGPPGRSRLSSKRGALAPLTDRERAVLELTGQGLATADIAARLGISPVTVRRHVGTVLSKLGVLDRAEAVRIAERAGARSRNETGAEDR